MFKKILFVVTIFILCSFIFGDIAGLPGINFGMTRSEVQKAHLGKKFEQIENGNLITTIAFVGKYPDVACIFDKERLVQVCYYFTIYNHENELTIWLDVMNNLILNYGGMKFSKTDKPNIHLFTSKEIIIRNKYSGVGISVCVDFFKPSYYKIVLEKERKREEAIARAEQIIQITDQRQLEDIGKNDNEDRVRAAAAGKITNKNVLEYIINNDKSPIVRLNIVKNSDFNNHNLLNVLAKNDKDSEVREAATEKIKDKKILEEISKNDNSYFVRKAAVLNENFNDISILRDLEKTDKNRYVREAAGARINMLRYEAEERRYKEVKLIKDIETLKNISQNDEFEKVREMAAKIVRTQEELINQAKTTGSLYALGMIIDQKAIADILINSDDKIFSKYALESALEMIKDEEVIFLIVKNAVKWKIRLEAIKKIKNQKYLSYIFQNDKHKKVIKAAKKRLKELGYEH